MDTALWIVSDVREFTLEVWSDIPTERSFNAERRRKYSDGTGLVVRAVGRPSKSARSGSCSGRAYTHGDQTVAERERSPKRGSAERQTGTEKRTCALVGGLN